VTVARRKNGRERGGGDNAMTDIDDDNDDDMNNNSNPTIKQCMGVRGRRKTVAAMDDGQQQNLVVNSAGTAPLAGGSGIRISASASGIPQNSVGKTSEKKNGVPVEKLESEFPILEFR
jgi:hypothetical protein